jgi:gliding motility-associated-like protein
VIKNRLFLIFFCLLFFYVRLLKGQTNDNCSGAQPLCNGNSISGSNITAGVQIGGIEADGDSAGTWGGCFSLQNSVWYSFTSNNNGGAATLNLTNILQNGNPSTLQVAVYLAPNGCSGPISSVSCDNISTGGSINLVGLQPNQNYLVLIDGYGNAVNFTKCTFTIEISGAAVQPIVQTTNTDAKCGNPNGSISVTSVSGGSGNYTYSLNQNGTYQTSPNFSNLTPGTYTVYIKDAAGCTYNSLPIQINQLPKISSFTINTTNADCNSNNGSVQIQNITGGNAPYTFSITTQNSNTTGIFNNLGAGNYYLTIQDANGCDTITTFFIEQNNGIKTAVPVSTPSVCNGATGTINFTGITGSSTPQSYVFNNTTYTLLPLTGIPAGNHFVDIIDNNGCKYTVYTAYVEEGTKPSANFNTTQEICNKQNGSISVFGVTGGVPPYTFSLNGVTPVSDSNFTNLSAGTYQLVIYDSYNCTDTLYPQVSLKTGATSAQLNLTPANCNVNNGAVTINSVSGGTSPYQFSIGQGNFQSSTNFFNLSPGSYPVIIKDANNCIDTVTSFIISEINKITDIQIQSTSVVCGSAGGTIIVNQNSITGGIAPYTFSLNGQPYTSNGNYTNLPLGTYTLSVKDINGCTYSTTTDLTPINSLSCEAGAGASIIRGGSVQLNAQTTAPSFSWTPSAGLSSVTELTPTASPKQTTTYILNGSSAEGCTCSDSVVVEVIPFINPPNAFTPDGDNVNDVWVIPYLQYYPNCEVDVYNRWGQRVFHSDGYPIGGEWDGKYLGSDVPVATYYYVIKLNSGIAENKDDELYKGSVTVVR